MGVYEHDAAAETQDAADAAALAQAEELILEIATQVQPSSLSELRTLLAGEQAGGLDPSLLRAALWALLNENRLELASDRTLRVAG
jgi:hypothetical protein